MPLSECSRRSRNSCPCPARRGATPCSNSFGSVDAGRLAEGLTVVAIKKNSLLENATFDYFAHAGKRQGTRTRLINFAFFFSWQQSHILSAHAAVNAWMR